MQNKYKSLIALAALALVAAAGGTWAYWSQELEAVNEFQVAGYSTEIHEEFTPPKVGEWAPGGTIKKVVTVRNLKETDVAVIAHVRQSWKRTQDVVDLDGNKIPPKKDEQYSLTFPTNKKPGDKTPGNWQYAAIVNWGKVVGLDAMSDLEKTAAREMGIEDFVSNLSEAKNEWVLLSVQPDEYGYSDLYFLYAGIVKGTRNVKEPYDSARLIESVKLNSKVESSITGKHTKIWYDSENKVNASETRQVINPDYGYDCAQFKLDIDAVTVQATPSAIRSIWSGNGIMYATPGQVLTGEAFMKTFQGMNETLCEEFINTFRDDLLPDYVDATVE